MARDAETEISETDRFIGLYRSFHRLIQRAWVDVPSIVLLGRITEELELIAATVRVHEFKSRRFLDDAADAAGVLVDLDLQDVVLNRDRLIRRVGSEVLGINLDRVVERAARLRT